MLCVQTGEEQEPAAKKKVVYGRKKAQPKAKTAEAEGEAHLSTAGTDTPQAAEVQAAAEGNTDAAQSQAEEAKAQAQQATEQQDKQEAEVGTGACKHKLAVWSNNICARASLPSFPNCLVPLVCMCCLYGMHACCHIPQHLGPPGLQADLAV